MADATPEIWRPVVGYEGWYDISDHGRVRRVGRAMGARVGRLIAYEISSNGYLRINLRRYGQTERFLVHHLVLEAFVGPRPPGYQCNHKDGDKTNNHPANLQWATPLQNNWHALRTGLRRMPTGERHPCAKLTQAQAQEIRRLRGTVSGRQIAKRFGVSVSTVSLIWLGKRYP